MKNFAAFLNLFFFIASLFVHFCPYISPQTHWIFSFFSLLVPIIALLNLLLFFIFLFFRSKKIIYPLIIVSMFAILYLKATVNVSIPSSNEESFKVLSYNVREFNRPRNYYFDRFWKGDMSMMQSRRILDFVVSDDAEIKCLQEYYNDSTSVIYNTRDRLEAKQYNCAQSTKLLRINRSHFGVAIFSKFPILNKGEILYATRNAHNRGVYADVLIHSDTVRIVNVHLESNRIRLSFNEKSFIRWKRAQEYRTRQVNQIADFVKQSPYPVVLCGDLNSTPYSYIYEHLNANLSNAFESEGTGFGGTYNHKIIKFLRIDNQFYSPTVSCENFETLNSVNFSDHFPIEGTYSIDEN